MSMWHQYVSVMTKNIYKKKIQLSFLLDIVNQVQKPIYGIQNVKSIQKSSTYVNA